MQITEFFSSKEVINILFSEQTIFFMNSRNRENLFNSSNFVSRMKSTFNKTSFINSFSINFRNSPMTKIRDQLIIINSVIFFIYNIRRTTSPGADRGVGSPQLIYTILGSTLSYHVFLTTVAFRNIYPNQPYTSHALHALTWLKRALQLGSRSSLYD